MCLPAILNLSNSFSCLACKSLHFFAIKWHYYHSSVGKESACNAGDPGSIPGSGRSAGDGIGYPLQYSWASLAAQLVKNPPAMWETRVRSLGWEDPLEKEKATHSSILAWRIPWTTVRGVAKSRTQVSDFHFHFPLILSFLSGSLLTYVSLFHSTHHVS